MKALALFFCLIGIWVGIIFSKYAVTSDNLHKGIKTPIAALLLVASTYPITVQQNL